MDSNVCYLENALSKFDLLKSSSGLISRMGMKGKKILFHFFNGHGIDSYLLGCILDIVQRNEYISNLDVVTFWGDISIYTMTCM